MVIVEKSEACWTVGGAESDDTAVVDGSCAKVIDSLAVEKCSVLRIVNNHYFTIFHRLFECIMLAADSLEERVFNERGLDRHGAKEASPNGGHIPDLGQPGRKKIGKSTVRENKPNM